MPFAVNNVDATVAANSIYSITMVALTDIADNATALIDADVEVYYTLHTLEKIMLEFFIRTLFKMAWVLK